MTFWRLDVLSYSNAPPSRKSFMGEPSQNWSYEVLAGVVTFVMKLSAQLSLY